MLQFYTVININAGVSDCCSDKMSHSDCKVSWAIVVTIAIILIMSNTFSIALPPLITHCQRKWTRKGYNRLISGMYIVCNIT